MNQPKNERRRKHSPKRRPRKGRRGLTLIEILVVVTILGIIASIVGITVADQLEESKVQAADIQIKEVSKALELYKVKYHRFPSTAEGLQALANPPGGKAPIMDQVPKDPWDGEYVYLSPGQHNQGKFDLYSKGPDGNDNTEDDVKNW